MTQKNLYFIVTALVLITFLTQFYFLEKVNPAAVACEQAGGTFVTETGKCLKKVHPLSETSNYLIVPQSYK